MRLDRLVSEGSALTRSQAAKAIRGGTVTLNGVPVCRPEQRVDENTDRICLGGKPVCYQRFHYYLMDKPLGLITASRDREAGTVLDLLPAEVKKQGVFPVGRLDKDTSGLLLLTRLTVRSSYAGEILPSLLLLGLGMGLTFMPVFATATAGIAPRDSGVTSATVNTAQQVGGSIGTALLNTLATTSAAAYVAARPHRPATVAAGVVHGYTVAIGWAAAIMLLAGLIAGLLVTARAPKYGPRPKAPVSEPVG